MPNIWIRELDSYLKKIFLTVPLTDYCPNGIQVEGAPEIKRIATGVSADLKTIEEAIALKAQALIVHHGLFWNGDSYPITGVKRQKLALLLEHNISLFAYHLPLDMNPEIGNNWGAAKEMGWSDLEPFGNYKGVPIGVKGKISPSDRSKFQEKLEQYYQHSATTALGGKETVTTVALISGGAYRNLSDAIDAEIDCFITGNFDEPAWNIAHEGKINFFALGHTATERVGPRMLAKHLQKELQVETYFIDTKNPF